MQAQVPSINTMAFYHSDGFVPAWKLAAQFAGDQGHIGTMLDVVDARIAAAVHDFPWNTYFTTASAEYFGYSKGGVRILIVAHGVGPMSTLEGIQKAYSFEYKSRDHNRRGGRISEQEFHKLEDGFYGEVSVVEFDPILDRREYPFSYLTASEALAEPLIKARLGSRTEEYVNHHAAMARKYHEKDHGRDIDDPYLFEMGYPSNCFYYTGGFGKYPLMFRQLDEGNGALAHLLSTGALANVGHQSKHHVSSLANDIGCHEWWNGVRLIGVRNKAKVTTIHKGVGDVYALLKKNWQQLMQPVTEAVDESHLYTLLLRENGEMFTQYDKKGDSLDTHEPEFVVEKAEKVGEPVVFKTSPGNQFSFCYDVREVKRIKPVEANAYQLISPVNLEEGLVQFYRVEVDTSKRIIKADALKNDYDLLMKLLTPKAA